MLNYPKIPDSKDAPLAKCVVFEKYDGTNTHFTWDRSQGWIEFGTRRDSFPLTESGQADFLTAHPELDHMVGVFAMHAPKLTAIFQAHYKDAHTIRVFMECFSAGTFAGNNI